MKKIFLLLGIILYQPVFSIGTTFTRDIIPFALGFENGLSGQKIRVYVRSIGNLRYLSRKVKFKIGNEYFEEPLYNYKTSKIADDSNKLTLGEFGYYEVSTKGSLLDHCNITNVHIELENSFQGSQGTEKENDQRDLTAFEKGNTQDCDELPLRMRKPMGQGIEL